MKRITSGAILVVISIVAIIGSISILIIQNNDPFRFDFLTEEQIKSIKQLESFCSDYSATSKMSCMNKIHAKILKYQIDGASEKAIQIDDVTVCHSITSDIDCLLAVAKKSNNKDACHEIINSKNNLKYLKAMQDYCLNWYKSS